jgi:glycosyltransferase involved in cell wall biosynthesis
MKKRVLIVQTMMKQYRVPFFDDLYKSLQQEGIELRVAYGNPPASEEKRQDNVELREPCGRKIRNRWLMGERLLLQSIFGEVRWSDLVIVEQASKNLMNYLLLLLSAIGLKKVAYWGHGSDRKGVQGSISERWKRRLINRVDWWFAYTPGTARYLLGCGVPKEIITTVFNSIDTKTFKEALETVTPSTLRDARKALGMDESRKIGLYCGALYREKHIGFLLKAAEFELMIIGGGSDEEDVMEAAQVHPWVHYLGPRFGHEKAMYFRMADVFLNPGLVGLAILDCFTAGLPLITTDVPVHAPEIDYLKDGANGLMIPHDPERYTEEVVRILRDEARLARMRGNALESGKRYSIETMVEYYKNGIVDCLSLRS